MEENINTYISLTSVLHAWDQSLTTSYMNVDDWWSSKEASVWECVGRVMLHVKKWSPWCQISSLFSYTFHSFCTGYFGKDRLPTIIHSLYSCRFFNNSYILKSVVCLHSKNSLRSKGIWGWKTEMLKEGCMCVGVVLSVSLPPCLLWPLTPPLTSPYVRKLTWTL